MTVAEYEAKFTEFIKFVPRLIEDERDRMHKFEMKLRIKIRKQVVWYKLTIYGDIINKILIIEREVNEERTEREKKSKEKK